MALRHARSHFGWLFANRENVSRGPENTIARRTFAVQLCNNTIADLQRMNAAILEELRRQGPEGHQVTAVVTMEEDGTLRRLRLNLLIKCNGFGAGVA